MLMMQESDGEKSWPLPPIYGQKPVIPLVGYVFVFKHMCVKYTNGGY